GLFAAVALSGAERAAAQAAPVWSPEQLSQMPRVPFKLYSFDSASAGGAAQTPQLPLLSMQAGYLANPLGIEFDEPGLGDDGGRGAEGDVDFLQFTFGAYNPYFDMRR